MKTFLISWLLEGRVSDHFTFFETGTICWRNEQKSEDITGSYVKLHDYVTLLVATALRLTPLDTFLPKAK